MSEYCACSDCGELLDSAFCPECGGEVQVYEMDEDEARDVGWLDDDGCPDCGGYMMETDDPEMGDEYCTECGYTE